MPKIKRTYALTPQAVKKLEEMALKESYEKGERIALGAVIEGLIWRAGSSATLDTPKLGNAAPKEKRALAVSAPIKADLLGDQSDLDDIIGG